MGGGVSVTETKVPGFDTSDTSRSIFSDLFELFQAVWGFIWLSYNEIFELLR